MARRITLKPRTCEGCGVEFTPVNGRQKYHSRECREEHAPYARNGNEQTEATASSVLAVIAAECDREIGRLDTEATELTRKREAAIESFDRRIASLEGDRAKVERVKGALAGTA